MGIEQFATYCGQVSMVLTLITVLVKPVRNFVVSLIIHNQKEAQNDLKLAQIEQKMDDALDKIDHVIETTSVLKRAEQTSLRSQFTSLYYEYLGEEEIPLYAKQNITMLKESYDELDGNTFVGECYKELMKKGTSNQ